MFLALAGRVRGFAPGGRRRWPRSFCPIRAAWYMGRRIIALHCLTEGELSEIQTSRLSKVNAEDQGADLTKAGAPDRLDLDAPGAADIAGLLKAGLRAAGALAKIGLDPSA